MTFEIREATSADRKEVEALVAEMIPGVDVAARIAWIYDQNPGGKAITWIAYEDGEAAGCTSFFPFRLWLDGHEVLAALGGDGYVRPKFRRRGLGAMLHDASRNAMPAHDLGCMYGAPGQMNLTPLKHGGSREVGLVSRWVRPLRKPGRFDRIVRAVVQPRRTATLSPMAKHDPRVEAVWLNAREELQLACVRDEAFYTWRFLGAPAGREPPYIIERHGEPIGACALERMGDTMRIVDLLAMQADWHACLTAIGHHVSHTQARALDIKLFSLDGRKRQMWRAGFAERETKPFLVMIPKHGDRRFLDPQRWFYGGADSDLDFLD